MTYKFQFRKVICEEIEVDAPDEDTALDKAMDAFFTSGATSGIAEGTIYDEENNNALMDFDSCRGWESAF